MAEPSGREHKIRQDLARFGDTAVRLLAPVIPNPDFPLRVIRLAQFMCSRHKPQWRLWEDLAWWGRQLALDDPKCLYHSDWVRRQRIPEWLFTMPHDEPRNQAFQMAIEYFVQPGMVVLEIGTGCGLLALMAARAGAGHVYTCEQEPVLADVAREIISQNGLSHRITVIPKNSSELAIGADIPEKADLLLNELADVRLLGYGILPIIEDARRRLLQPQAEILPQKITAPGMLVGGPGWRQQCRVEKICGFDLSYLNHFAPSELPVFSDADLAESYSEPFDLFSFDFAKEEAFPADCRQLEVTVTRTGRIEGLVQWIRLDFHEGIVFENRPPVRTPSRPRFHIFPETAPVQLGNQISLHLEHDREHIYVRPCSEED